MIADDELAQVAQAGGDDVEHRRGADGFGILHQPRGAEPGCAPHGARIGRELAGENFQERRLAGAIPADDRDALTGLDEEAGMIEQRNVAERRRHVFQGNQGMTIGRSGSGSQVLRSFSVPGSLQRP